MKPLIHKASALIVLLLFAAFGSLLQAASSIGSVRTITLAGLVNDSKNLTPIKGAMLVDGNGKNIGITNDKGYYHVVIECAPGGEIHFKVTVVKEGFETLPQQEHWGNLDNNNVNCLYYFGLSRKHAEDGSFSSLRDIETSDLSLAFVNIQFNSVVAERAFNSKIESLKAGNENVFVALHGHYYLVDETGWIKLNSDKDLVRINNAEPVMASKLNFLVKRSHVTGMTPVQAEKASFALFTSNHKD